MNKNNPNNVNDETALIQKFIDVQSQEVQLKKSEVALRDKEIDINHKLAVKSIDAQLTYQSKEAELTKYNSNRSFVIWIVIIASATMIAMSFIYTGNTEHLSDILKILIGAFFGFLGGKASTKSGSSNQSQNQD